MHVCTSGQLVRYVVYAERDVLEQVIVISGAHGGRQSVFQLVEVQLRVLEPNHVHKLVEILARDQGQARACVHNDLVHYNRDGAVAVRNVAHRQRPIISIKEVVPDDVAFGVSPQIEATDHHGALLEVFADGEGKQVLIDLALQVELLDEKSRTVATSNRSKTYDAVTGHARKTLLVGSGDEGHIVHALVVRRAEADLVGGAVPPDVATAVTHLAELRAHLLESFRLNVVEGVFGSAGRTLWRLYPEPRAACVENQLMWLMSAAEVHC